MSDIYDQFAEANRTGDGDYWRNQWEAAQAEVERLRNRVSRLRKAVNWLRGALHDESHGDSGYGTNDDCTQWECQRARAVLDEEAG